MQCHIHTPSSCEVGRQELIISRALVRGIRVVRDRKERRLEQALSSGQGVMGLVNPALAYVHDSDGCGVLDPICIIKRQVFKPELSLQCMMHLVHHMSSERHRSVIGVSSQGYYRVIRTMNHHVYTSTITPRVTR